MSFAEYDPDQEPYDIGSRAMFNGIQYLKTYHGNETAPGTLGSKWVDEEWLRANPIDETERRIEFCNECHDQAKQLLETAGLDYETIKNLLTV